jgi:pimeloyl-ACP methyl ester carboxylesterase
MLNEQPISRRTLLGAGGAVASGALLAGTGTAVARARPTAGSSQATQVLLVHGAWADGSSWSSVIELLQLQGFTVTAVQLAEQSLSGDVAVVQNAIAAISGPLVLAGHSYGGAVISGAATGAANVKALVFVAAYAPDAGETVLGLNAEFPATPIVSALVFDSEGNATVDPSAFPTIFMPDVPLRRAQVLAAVQHPINAAAFQEPAGAPAWKTIPSYYQVSTNDQVINPDLERFFATRMNARTFELASSHASLVSHPFAIAELIALAAKEA